MQSLLRCLARPRPRPVGRAYSFFSSKPGGGRHFVSAKPPKPVLQPGRANPDNTTPAQDASAASPPANASSVAKADDKQPSKPAEPHPKPSPPPASTASPDSSLNSGRPPIHPTLSSKEYTLHQFFSLHRPLLLLDQPTSAIFDAADPCSPSFVSSKVQLQSGERTPFITIDNPPESSPDADADAARQLAHALVMNRVAGVVAWQQVLSRLGSNTKCSKNDMSLAKETAQEWVTIHADSTRRKKRKKMKKHKLKKRRRLTRRQNK